MKGQKGIASRVGKNISAFSGSGGTHCRYFIESQTFLAVLFLFVGCEVLFSDLLEQTTILHTAQQVFLRRDKSLFSLFQTLSRPLYLLQQVDFPQTAEFTFGRRQAGLLTTAVFGFDFPQTILQLGQLHLRLIPGLAGQNHLSGGPFFPNTALFEYGLEGKPEHHHSCPKTESEINKA
jgi:hypothetical protein